MIFHYIVTLASGAAQCTLEGTYTTKPDETRQEAFTAIFAGTKRTAAKQGINPSGCVVAFFSFEPNEIGA